MADVIAVANVGSVSPDEEESYLYGETSEGRQSAPTAREDEVSSRLEFVSNGHVAEEDNIVENNSDNNAEDQNDEDGEFEESDDDEDDNIQVHIGEVNTSGTNPGVYGTPVNWKKDATGNLKSAVLPTQGQKKIDVNAVGLINGQPIYEYDMDNDQDDKPWRKPGADISDYFNYGFTEDTWKQYCEKQRRMRLETNRGSYIVTTTPSITPAQVEIEVLPDGRTRVKAGPPPDRKVEGSIHVIGSDADARRKQKEDELLALALGSTRVIAPSGFPGQRPIYTALPGGTMMFNPETSQPQQIQSIGGGTSGLPPGLQFLPHVSQSGMQSMSGGPQMYPPSMSLGDPFLHPGNMVPPGSYNFAAPNHYESDSEYDSDNESRRHRSSRRESSRHRRHRDRSDRDRSDRSDRDRDRDRDRSKTRSDRDRSSSRAKREHSKASSDRKKRSSRSVKQESGEGSEEPSERKSRSSRRSKHVSDEPEDKKDITKVEGVTPSVKEEPAGD
ncbi:pre-mRNA 3'-end-processing factor FIP1 isoform X2 [Hydra vulgaris]|uniref:Pre-mRNA 3'-end-processing factor FIP1 isoform X2 n=1 Tax=Hydra vulgaris TaxID=6087 RepID=A0ABM4D605_HYDVU